MKILAIDQAAVSGWCLVEDGRYVDSGYTKSIECIKELLLDEDVDLYRSLVVFEDHSGMRFSRGNMTSATLLGLGAARGRWEMALWSHVHRHAYTKVTPREWRTKVLGLKNPKAEVAKGEAVLRAAEFTGKLVSQIEQNEAEAVCIALWACDSAEARALWTKCYAGKAGRR